MSVSPLDSNVLTSPTVDFKLENGQVVSMTVDIDLEGNTGEPKFTMEVPDVFVQNYVKSRSFSQSNHTREGGVTDEVMELIKNDSSGIVKANYDNIINGIRDQIENEGGNLQLFNERLSENGNADSETTIAEASIKKDNSENVRIDDEGISIPESVKIPQVKKI